MKNFNITFLGVGGSSAAHDMRRGKYGTNTSCILLKLDNRYIVLDMGTGFVRLAELSSKYEISMADILVSHYHYDHVEGLPLFSPFFDKGNYNIYGQGRENLGTREIFERLLSKPFSPLTIENFVSDIKFYDIKCEETFYLHDKIEVRTMELNHPGGATAYRINFDGRSLVYALDHEHGTSCDEKLAEFAKGADIMICDAHFTQKEYDDGKYIGWGHSTMEECANIAKRANVKRMVLTHHAVWRTDAELDEIGKNITEIFADTVVAMEGMELSI